LCHEVHLVVADLRKATYFVIALAPASVAACSGTKTPAAANPEAGLHGIASAVATATGYPATAIEVTGSRSRLRLAISDTTLSGADQSLREQMARKAVAAAEQEMRSSLDYEAVEAVSVAIIDSSPKDSPAAWHVEDVVEFRRGSDRRFQLHTT